MGHNEVDQQHRREMAAVGRKTADIDLSILDLPPPGVGRAWILEPGREGSDRVR